MICGIDPGISGALCFFYYKERKIYIHDLPIIGKEINGKELSIYFYDFIPEHVFLERVNSFGMGRQSAFNFGQGVGVIKGVLQSLSVPFSLVTPQEWKKFYHLSKDKNKSRSTATNLFPKNSEDFQRKKDDGRAESALIAHYGYYKIKGDKK